VRHRVLLTLTATAAATHGLTPPAWAGCPEPNSLVTQTEAAVLEGRFADVERLLEETELAFGCSAPAQKSTLARMWGAEGVWLSLTDDEAGAADAFAAAWRVDPATWNADFGDRLRATANAAVAAMPPVGTGQLRLAPEPLGWTTHLDGHPAPSLGELTGGLHLVQIVDLEGHAQLARIVYIAAGQRAELSTTGLPPLGPPPASVLPAPLPPPAPVSAVPAAPGPVDAMLAVRTIEPTSFPTWLLVATAASMGAGATAWLATQESTRMDKATTVEALDAAFARQKRWAGASYGLMGLTGTGLVLHFKG
jgi:hypothetical protein